MDPDLNGSRVWNIRIVQGDWNETDIFFRGNGEIIGATRMDEALLDEQRKAEALEEFAVEEVRRSSVPSEGIKEGRLKSSNPVQILIGSAWKVMGMSEAPRKNRKQASGGTARSRR